MKLFVFQDLDSLDIISYCHDNPAVGLDSNLRALIEQVMPPFQFRFIGLFYAPAILKEDEVESWRQNIISIISQFHPKIIDSEKLVPKPELITFDET